MRTIGIVVLLASLSALAFGDEGMYPLSLIDRLDLKGKGIKVSPKNIYNPGAVSLIDAIVQVGGCTGSFVSPEGLIITNHHCAFGAVQSASVNGRDYITEGFTAGSRADEFQAKGYTVRITESYRDVSKEVLSAVSDTMEAGARTKAIDKRMKELIAEAEKAGPGKRVEVSEMFAGKSYVLFVYTFLRDVRVVYVPPRSIGEFGGENDNWVWPRHTGDFSFLRAYSAPDGSPADYSPANVPYKPKKFLKVNPKGVDDGDAVFILGYPGRTFRHRTSHYLAFEQTVRMPYIADLYAWEISVMEALGEHDRAVAIKHDGRIKGLANVMKNYRGKLQGLGRLNLVGSRQREEEDLQKFIDADPRRREMYGTLLADIGSVFTEMQSAAEYELALDNLQSSSILLSAALSVHQASRELAKADLDREAPYMTRNFTRTKDNVRLSLGNYYQPTDSTFLREMLSRCRTFSQFSYDSIAGGGTLEAFIHATLNATRLADSSYLMSCFSKSPEGLDSLKDPMIALAGRLSPYYRNLREIRQRRDGKLSQLYAKLIEVKEQFLKKNFIPDANSTLRLTFGRIQGYSPADALYSSPITTLKGVVEKTTGREPFNSPQKLIELSKAKSYGKFAHKKLKDVPVALLYNLDTTGGNSGSPLLNAAGEVVGVNFDRAYEATINDYAWSQAYSRSIAVDIRYVLWVLQQFAGNSALLTEMGIE